MFRSSDPNPGSRRLWLGCLLVSAAGAAAWLAATAGAQERTIVANRIEVSGNAASLLLEFADGEPLSVSLADGRASANGVFLGDFEPGGAADREWRDLLARVLSLSDGPLALELKRWRPDTGLGGGEGTLLAALSGHFADALEDAAGTDVREAEGEAGGQGLLEAMARSEHREGLASALADTDLESLRVLVDRDHVVRAGTSVESGFLIVDGDLDVRGRVRGDVIVVDGTLILAPDGRIDGDVRLVESELESSGGEVGGDVTDVTRTLRRQEREAEERIRTEVRSELGHVTRAPPQRPGRFYWKVRRAAGVTFDTIVFFAFMGLFAWVLAGRARERVGVVVRAIAHQPARSAAVGLAGAFAMVPLYLAGIAALAVTLVGIPVLIAWVPLFPLAVVAAAFTGLVGVSHHVGRWVLNRGFRWLRWADRPPPSDAKLLGLGTLFAPFVVGEWVRVLPFTGWVGDLLEFAGAMGFFLAAVTGFGAVILTRGGTRPTRWVDAFEDYGGDDPGEWASR